MTGAGILIKPKLWGGDNLSGPWLVTLKLDGVRCLISDSVATSRSGKPLHNIVDIPDGDYEVFSNTWEESVSKVRTQNSKPVPVECFYSLSPIDDRLLIGELYNPTHIQILDILDDFVRMGYEGLVLRQGNKWLKVKPTETFDVAITSIQEGTGKYIGKLGAFVTEMGKVGTGLSDKDREELYSLPVGTIIEVECMSLTPNGKFRHPRFKRVRYDK